MTTTEQFLEAVDDVATNLTEVAFGTATYQTLANGDKAFTEKAQDFYNETTDRIGGGFRKEMGL